MLAFIVLLSIGNIAFPMFVGNRLAVVVWVLTFLLVGATRTDQDDVLINGVPNEISPMSNCPR